LVERLRIAYDRVIFGSRNNIETEVLYVVALCYLDTITLY